MDKAIPILTRRFFVDDIGEHHNDTYFDKLGRLYGQARAGDFDPALGTEYRLSYKVNREKQ